MSGVEFTASDTGEVTITIEDDLRPDLTHAWELGVRDGLRIARESVQLGFPVPARVTVEKAPR